MWGLPIDLGTGLVQLWSFGGSSAGASSISRCQWQSLDSSYDVTFAGGSQWEHVGLRKRKGRGKKGASKQKVSVSYQQSYLRRACSAIVIVRSNDSAIDHCGSPMAGCLCRYRRRLRRAGERRPSVRQLESLQQNQRDWKSGWYSFRSDAAIDTHRC